MVGVDGAAEPSTFCNVEEHVQAVKRRFGDAVRSKTDTAMVNEVFCKLLAHNRCVLIQEEHELGIESIFWMDTKAGAGDRAV